jgi:hypothetical protein
VVVRSLAFLAVLTVCGVCVRWISSDAHPYAYLLNSPVAGHNEELSLLAGPHSLAIQSRNRRLVYPYSVVPGGVESAEELRQVTAHDAIVAAHYSGFDYKRARVIEVDRPRLVYLSYRRGGQIYWTRKQASLHPGEKLLTDGQMTARARCGNQVSVLPQANTSPEEPMMAELDRPDAVASGMEEFPANFDSNLLNVDPVMPIAPSSPGNTFVGGGRPPGGFVPLPIAGGGGGASTPDAPPAPVPEPGTVVLVLSGVGALWARWRLKKH